MAFEIPGYSTTRSVGAGGMTKLYLALDAQQNRYLLRVLNAELEKNRTARKRFLASAAILAALQQPREERAFPKLVKSGEQKGRLFMLLEYVDGRSLRELIQAAALGDKRLERNVLSLMRQLARAVQAVHAHGYLHLDIKPENVLVEEETDRLVLTDFDLAIPRKRFFKRVRELPGTTAYVAPETLANHRPDDQSDVYSFGVTCYEMLSLHRPYEGTRIDDVRAMQADPKTPPTPIRQHVPNLSAALANWVMKCIAKNPADRYPDMTLVLRDLGR